jgi:hypothetical protein
MYAIYQVRDDIADARGLRFAPLRELEKQGIAPNRDDYKLVYAAPITERMEYTTDKQHILNGLYERFNAERPDDFAGRSMSVSDVVVLRHPGDMTAHYVDTAGFVEIYRPAFYGAPAEDRAEARAAELAAEPSGQTFSQVDKRPGEPPTLAELEADVKAGKAISLMDLAKAVNGAPKRPAQDVPAPAQKGKLSILAELEENKILAAQYNKSAGQKTTEREVE